MICVIGLRSCFAAIESLVKVIYWKSNAYNQIRLAQMHVFKPSNNSFEKEQLIIKASQKVKKYLQPKYQILTWDGQKFVHTNSTH